MSRCCFSLSFKNLSPPLFPTQSRQKFLRYKERREKDDYDFKGTRSPFLALFEWGRILPQIFNGFTALFPVLLRWPSNCSHWVPLCASAGYRDKRLFSGLLLFFGHRYWAAAAVAVTLTKGGLLGQIVFQWVPSNFSLLLRVNKVVLFDDIYFWGG